MFFSEISQDQLYLANPIGLDKWIQKLQTKLFDNVSWLGLCFGKAFHNETPNGSIPEVYIGDNEYLEVLPSDTLGDCNSYVFFDVDQTSQATNPEVTSRIRSQVGVVLFARLDQVFDNDTRDTERIKRDLLNQVTGTEFRFSGFKEGPKNVYSNYGFAVSQVLNDMQPYYVLRMDLNINYDYKC